MERPPTGARIQENNLNRYMPIFALVMTAWCIAGSPARATQESNAFERDIAKLNNYCIGRVCLGMSIKEVAGLGKLEWNAIEPPDGRLTCHDRSGNSVTGYLKTKDQGLMLSFDLVSMKEIPEERYRLNGISVLYPAATASTSLIHLESFKAKLGPLKEVLAQGLWTDDQRPFAITVGTAPADTHLPNRLLLLATYRPRSAWIKSLPQCRQSMP